MLLDYLFYIFNRGFKNIVRRYVCFLTFCLCIKKSKLFALRCFKLQAIEGLSIYVKVVIESANNFYIKINVTYNEIKWNKTLKLIITIALPSFISIFAFFFIVDYLTKFGVEKVVGKTVRDPLNWVFFLFIIINFCGKWSI